MKFARKKVTKARTKPRARKSPARKAAVKKKTAAKLDDLLDRELEDTFPASDPLELTEPGGARKSPVRRKKRRRT